MTDLDDINDAIGEAIAGPKSVKVADQEVESRPVSELIDAGNYVASQTAQDITNFGMRHRQLRSGAGGFP